MTEPALSLAFFDPTSQIYGAARSGLTLVFDGTTPTALPSGAEITRTATGYRAGLEDRLELDLEATSEPLFFPGSTVRVCRVTGSAAGRRLEGLGTATETVTPPAWEELDAVRSLSVLFDLDHAVLATARRPRGALGHGQETVTAHVLSPAGVESVEEARLSTLYDGEGRQRSAGLELWMPGQDFPRRGTGRTVAGASLALEGLRVNAAVFAWTMEGREGLGAYDVTVRDEREAA
ncbi:MAG: hypothetical protein H0V55_03265 [Thermoleophilaceae bacterium]|nr:hypothetical protein [Thermoleophilaceae bacterium]MBA3838981.1 hypothetical protein [Thermoleophilaceae bacterium]